jgi:hypothetical protein
MPSQKHPLFSAKNVEPSQVYPLSLYVARLSFLLALFKLYNFALFPFWYVIKKTKKSSNGAACSPIYPKIRAIYFLIIKLSAPPGAFKRKAKGKRQTLNGFKPPTPRRG